MDKNRIKKFAIWARTELITRVTQRAYFYGVDGKIKANPEAGEINGRILTEDERRKRMKLVQRVQEKGFRPVMEEAAYTWFNRFAALRYMEVNGVLPTRVRVFSNRDGAFAPQILDECLTMENLDGLDKSVLFDLKEKDATEELYKYLLITQCNALGSLLPVMFQQIEDYTELLLPDNLLREGSVIHQLVTEIEEDDWRDQVQIIGWLYQYYNSEPKDAIFAALKKNIKVSKENIPAATQLFTPDWIVRYMVENSLGRLWTEHKCAVDDSKNEKELAEGYEWKYYLPEAEQEPDVASKLKELRESRKDLRPEEIKIIDPCMGSGHILVYAFDVLVQIYKDAGYREKDIPELILKNNLYGLDIDDRAYQLAYFAVMMRAWHYNHRILVKRIEPNLCAIQESNGMSKWSEPILDMSGEQQMNFDSQFVQLADELIEKFQDAKEYGSILDVEDKNYEALLNYVKSVQESSVLDLSMTAWLAEVEERLPHLVKQAKIMGQKYDVVVTNPPYMGSRSMITKMISFIRRSYPNSKMDLFSVFIEKCSHMTNISGYLSMVTMHSWMFLSSFEKLRKSLINNFIFTSINHLGMEAFDGIIGKVVATVAFSFKKNIIDRYNGVAVDLTNYYDAQRYMKESKFLSKENRVVFNQENIKKIPSLNIAYWASDKLIGGFEKGISIDTISDFTGSQNITADNDKYLRYYWEVSEKNIKNNRWKFYAKGGQYRRWFGNIDLVVNWTEEAINFYDENPTSNLLDKKYWNKEGITYTDLTNSLTAFRYLPINCVFDKAGPSIVNVRDLFYCLALLNSKVAQEYFNILNSSLHTQVRDVKSIPLIFSKENQERIKEISAETIELSKIDWSMSENAWDFNDNPIIGVKNKLVSNEAVSVADLFLGYKDECEKRFNKLKSNEEELNRIFLDIYDLADELPPEVADKDVTVARIYDTKEEIPDSMKGNNYVLTREDVVKSLLSYAVGCMFGRYSLDEPGLICAGGEFDPSRYETYHPDEDAIVPICDDEYFEDDIVERFCIWIKAAFGEEHYRENLQFVADALEGKGTPMEIIRSYFLNDFYTDHCKRYQKRPIYWLFDAGKKNSFKALVYLHRYDKDTLARMRANYVYKQQELYKTRIETTQNRIDTAASQADKNKFKRDLKKLREQFDEIHLYEEKIHHYADLRQEIDLDDGVKHNYALFEDVLAKIK